MGKAIRVLLAAVLTSLVFLVIAGPVFAGSRTVEPMACWNNCGIGGVEAKYK